MWCGRGRCSPIQRHPRELVELKVSLRKTLPALGCAQLPVLQFASLWQPRHKSLGQLADQATSVALALIRDAAFRNKKEPQRRHQKSHHRPVRFCTGCWRCSEPGLSANLRAVVALVAFVVGTLAGSVIVGNCVNRGADWGVLLGAQDTVIQLANVDACCGLGGTQNPTAVLSWDSRCRSQTDMPGASGAAPRLQTRTL